jgi:4'-phosphopantetheinyl transferase EntD
MDADPAVSIGVALRAVAPRGVRVGARSISSDDEQLLLPAELVAIGSAAPKRRREFATGRVLLRDVVGCDDAIPAGPDRRPVLPAGVVASLAHDDRIAIAAATATDVAAAIGIDVEPMGELEPEVAKAILRPDDATHEPVLAFVLKEAAYKAWSNAGGRVLHHHEVRLDIAGSAFTAFVEPEGTALHGRFASAAGRWLSLVVL